jgi:hypothetical protein
MKITDDSRFIMTDGSREMSDEQRCPNSWFGSHRFEARYDMEPNNSAGFSSIETFAGNIESLFTKKSYVRDICIKCGKTIEREMLQNDQS